MHIRVSRYFNIVFKIYCVHAHTIWTHVYVGAAVLVGVATSLFLSRAVS